MDKREEKEHAEHTTFAQDHFGWRAEHMQALAVLRRVEARILDQEATMIAHDDEIAAHEQFLQHGAQHASAPEAHDHASLSKLHKSMENNEELVKAVLALRTHLD